MTFDRPAPGDVVAQPRRGFRYTSDSMWLAGIVIERGAPGRALDLGTGSGVVAMLLAARGSATVGLDHQPEWRAYWAETLAHSQVDGSVELRVHDVGVPFTGGYEAVVCNPPYFPSGHGPVAPDPFKAAARTESTAPLARFVQRAIGALAPGGVATFVVPRERDEELVRDAVAAGGGARRVVRVGRRRSLVELEGSVLGPPQVQVFAERDPQVLRWVALATGRG